MAAIEKQTFHLIAYSRIERIRALIIGYKARIRAQLDKFKSQYVA
jgi:hypothetical protein